MRNAIVIFQIVVSLLLVVSVIMQSRGTQLGMAFGGAGETFRSKRGLEKLLYYFTIVLAVLFGSSSILLIVMR